MKKRKAKKSNNTIDRRIAEEPTDSGKRFLALHGRSPTRAARLVADWRTLCGWRAVSKSGAKDFAKQVEADLSKYALEAMSRPEMFDELLKELRQEPVPPDMKRYLLLALAKHEGYTRMSELLLAVGAGDYDKRNLRRTVQNWKLKGVRKPSSPR